MCLSKDCFYFYSFMFTSFYSLMSRQTWFHVRLRFCYIVVNNCKFVACERREITGNGSETYETFTNVRMSEFTYYELLDQGRVFDLLLFGKKSRNARRRIFICHVRIFDYAVSLFFSPPRLYAEFFLATENLCALWPFLVNFTAC